MGSQEEFQRRKRRRKTKSERDKTRTSVPSQGDVDVKQDVSRHLKMARNVSYPLRSMVGMVGEKNIITQSRLTRRLGLYNQSKTSRKICRGTIIMPETVRKKTEEDLRKILDLTEKMPSLQMEVDIDGMSPGLPALDKHRESKCSATTSHCVPSSGISLPCTSLEVTPIAPGGSIIKTKHSISSKVSACASSDEMEDIEDELPSFPPMAEIAEYLCSELKNQTMFKERDLVQEICDDLMKNFRSIGPQCATPSITENENSVAAGSIRRTLLNSYINSPNKENTDLLVSTAKIVISQSVPTSEANSSDHRLPFIYESKPENLKNVVCKSLAFNESCKHNLLINNGTMHSNENDQRQECADALILLGQTNQEVQKSDERGTANGTNKSGRQINSNLETDDISVLTYNCDRNSAVDSTQITEIQSSPDALSLLVQNDKNETSLLSKQMNYGSSQIKKDAFRSYRNFKIIENHLKHREASLKLTESNPHCHQKTSSINCADISKLYKSNCSQHLKEHSIPHNYSQTTGFHSRYSQISNVSNTVSSLDQLLNCDRPLERYPCSGEHTFIAPRSLQKVHRPLESHRQNLALAIQSAALPWTKDISFEDRTKTAVVTEFQHPEFMPRFHGDFYKDALLFEDDVWPDDKRSVLSANEASEDMDILEYLDHGEESNSGQVHHNLHRHGNKIYSRKLLRPGSPDSDGSPTWIAPDTSMRPWKPNLDSPGSPQKMYPRRLY